VLDYPDKPWNWDELSRNINITLTNIFDHPDKPWDWDWISENPNITFKDVLDHPDKSWNWDELSRHPNITFKDVFNHSNKPWNWHIICINSKIINTYFPSLLDLGIIYVRKNKIPTTNLIDDIKELI
jgi:hypothetical protein